MEQGVYVDVLLATNYAVNLAIILCVARFSGRSCNRRRTVAASLVGAAASLTIFLPSLGFGVSFLLKLAVSGLVVFTAFSWAGVKIYLEQLFLFFAISFCFAGIMLGLWLLLQPPGMSWYNGVVYFDISPVLLIGSTAAAYLLLSLAARITRPKTLKREIYPVSVEYRGRSAGLRGFVDTGNSLKEPFSGYPVAVCRAELLKDLALQDASLRVVPYGGIGGGGLLEAFRPDNMLIETPGKTLKVEQVYVGLSKEPVGDGSYNCLLSPELMAYSVSSANKDELKVAAK